MTAEQRQRAVPLLIWAAYFLVPCDAGGLIDGLPIGPIEAAGLLAIGWLALYGGTVRFSRVAAIILIATTAASVAIPGHSGLRARYFATAEALNAPERSPEFLSSTFTRIDARLDFLPGHHDLPLNFFNDNTRYSLFQVAYTRHDQLPFSVRWTGEWFVSSDVDALYVNAPKATGEVFIDGAKIASVAPSDSSPASVAVTLTPGWHRLDVALSSPYGGSRQFSAGYVRDGVRRPFDATEVVTQRIRDWQMTSAGVLRICRLAADVAALFLVAITFAVAAGRKISALFRQASDADRRRQVMALFAIVASIDALRVATPWASRVRLLVSGDDTLTYETFARDILFNGVLMSGGKPLGHGDPFYYQAFYPYFLALEHLIGGEFMFGVVLIQRLLAIYAIFTLVEISIRFTSERVWIIALPMAAAFTWWKFSTIAGQPLNESLYVPLLVGSIAALIRVCDEPRPSRAVWAGVIGGLAAITRTTALPAWLLALPLVSWSLRGRQHRGWIVPIMLASFLAVFSLIAIRNWIVAGVFAPTPTEMGITLRGGNEPPPGLTIDAGRAAIYRRLGFDDHTAVVAEYALQQPGAFAANIGRKFVFVLGFYEPYAPGWGYSPVYIATWLSALVGMWLVIRNRSGAMWPLLIPAVFALIQFAAIVVIYPKGERLVVPIHIVLIPYSAAAVWFALNSRSSEAANVNLIASRTST
jgi:hypothetical protein